MNAVWTDLKRFHLRQSALYLTQIGALTEGEHVDEAITRRADGTSSLQIRRGEAVPHGRRRTWVRRYCREPPRNCCTQVPAVWKGRFNSWANSPSAAP